MLCLQGAMQTNPLTGSILYKSGVSRIASPTKSLYANFRLCYPSQTGRCQDLLRSGLLHAFFFLPLGQLLFEGVVAGLLSLCQRLVIIVKGLLPVGLPVCVDCFRPLPGVVLGRPLSSLYSGSTISYSQSRSTAASIFRSSCSFGTTQTFSTD